VLPCLRYILPFLCVPYIFARAVLPSLLPWLPSVAAYLAQHACGGDESAVAVPVLRSALSWVWPWLPKASALCACSTTAVGRQAAVAAVLPRLQTLVIVHGFWVVVSAYGLLTVLGAVYGLYRRLLNAMIEDRFVIGKRLRNHPQHEQAAVVAGLGTKSSSTNSIDNLTGDRTDTPLVPVADGTHAIGAAAVIDAPK